ncbi:MAG: hypothetical protein COA30_01285 [Sulfurimonas sp.]|nr:MAG: hypothetical protein COA30_01285 [Sulfurimonas sp.]
MTRYFIIFIFFGTIVFADKSSAMDIDAQIQEIRTASPEMRVQLMNEFKKRLAQMNQSERLDAIKSMQTKSRPKSSQAIQKKIMQIDTNEDLVKYQNMNQEQAGNRESQIQRPEYQNHQNHQNFNDGQF